MTLVWKVMILNLEPNKLRASQGSLQARKQMLQSNLPLTSERDSWFLTSSNTTSNIYAPLPRMLFQSQSGLTLIRNLFPFPSLTRL